MDISIIFEDSDLLIINKPAGITVNRAETTKNEKTIQDWSENYISIKYQVSSIKYGEEGWTPELEFYQRGGIVHRLDKETSGILVLAKTPEAFVALQKQFKERTIKKTYVALAHGIITPKKGEIGMPVGRLPWNRNRFGVLPGGKESKTNYTVLAYYISPIKKEKLTLVELYPQSGRTHQIRVHLKYINHPIFADSLYAGRKTARADRKILTRVFLHATKISLIHPTTHTAVLYEASLAKELADFLKHLEKIPQ